MRTPEVGAFCLLVLSMTRLTGQEPKQPDNGSEWAPFSMTFEKGTLSVRFEAQPLDIVSHVLAQRSKIAIVLADSVADNRVTQDIKSETLDEALRALFADYDTFFFYGSSKGEPSVLRSVWVYPKGSASDLKPVPRSDWAGVRELEAALSDTDPRVRETAYVALLERADDRSRKLVLDAIRGSRERDAVLRERLLSNAISRGHPIPAEVLTDLARSDASEQIRWMALDALAFSQYPSARDVAEAATTDPSETVRLRAKEMLNQLGSGRREQYAETDIESPSPSAN